MKVLHLDSSALGGASVSRQLSGEIVRAIRAQHPEASVTYRDLAAQPLSHLDGALLSSLRPAPGAAVEPNADLHAELALTETLVNEFLNADVVVVGAPMYNFSVPSQLKAWIDRVAQAGRTFRYTANGPEGLAGGKKVVVASSRGGALFGTAAEAAMDHQEAFLKTIFSFFGITDITVLRAEKLGMGPQAREQSITQAIAQVDAIADDLAEAFV